jgi:formyltetrahydrofolate synthetase
MGQLTNTASGILTGINSKFDGITSMAKGVLCLPQLFSPENLKYLTANIGTYLAAYAANVVTSLANFVTDTISRNIQNVAGVITSQLNAINNFIKDIKEAIQLIKTYAENLEQKMKDTWDFLTDTENCNFAAAEIGKCLISDILDELPKSVTKGLSDGTLDLNNKVLDITEKLRAPEKSLTRYYNQAQKFGNKARIQQMF